MSAPPNALFAIMSVTNPDALRQKLNTRGDWAALEVESGQWLVSAPAATTAKEMSDALGFNGDLGEEFAIILRVQSYFGRNFRSVWEWIQTKQEAQLWAA